jgi:cbb3-type cytochrome oxidase subunit 3
MGGIILVIIKYLITESTIVSFLGLAVLSIFLYLVILWVFDRFSNYGIRQIFNEQTHLVLQSIKKNRMKQ